MSTTVHDDTNLAIVRPVANRKEPETPTMQHRDRKWVKMNVLAGDEDPKEEEDHQYAEHFCDEPAVAGDAGPVLH